MVNGRRKTKKLPLNVESPSPPLSKYCLLVSNAVLKCGGQAIIQVGLLRIPHSIEAGLWATGAVWQCFSFSMVLLETVLLCEALDGDPTVSIGQFHYQIATSFCSVHLRLLHCKMRNMFCCGKLCTLVLSLWDFTCYSCKGDDDIKIQRRHIKLGNNELKRQFATTERWAAGTEATELFSAEFHPNMAQTQNGVAKIHGSGDWFDGWLCARKRRCRSLWNDKRENSFRWKIEGKSGENLWNTVLLSGVLILLDCVCLS